jgi:3-hydroxybutyryl-CoA dehydratase
VEFDPFHYDRGMEVLPTSIKVGDQFLSRKKITEDDIKLFAVISGDHNPLHLDAEFASKSIFKQRVAHGMLTASLISAALASMPGTIILLNISLSFEKPVYVNDSLTAKVTTRKIEGGKIHLEAEISRGNDRVVSGKAMILRR